MASPTLHTQAQKSLSTSTPGTHPGPAQRAGQPAATTCSLPAGHPEGGTWHGLPPTLHTQAQKSLSTSTPGTPPGPAQRAGQPATTTSHLPPSTSHHPAP